MARVTKKWCKEFAKRYTDALNQIRSLDKEIKEVRDNNPDEWFQLSYLPIKDTTLEMGPHKEAYVFDYGDREENPIVQLELEFENFSVQSDFTSLKDLIEFRNKLIEAIDEFQRPLEPVKETVDDDCEEEDENWEDNPYEEYTIQASRECVQTWTHTVQARSSCEAYRLVQEDVDGSTHDQNDDYDEYGDIDWEII